VTSYSGDVTDIGRIERIREDAGTCYYPSCSSRHAFPETERDPRSLHNRHNAIHKWSPRQMTCF